MVDLAKNYYCKPIFFIYLDGELVLSNAFDNLYSINGIIIERILLYTKEPNGKVKATRKMISIKGWCIGISAKLPYNLWLEIVVVAVYILNRTPLFRTGITLFKALYGIKLTLLYMYIYGC